MKVKIGKYPSRLTCRIHTRYMDRKYGIVDWPVYEPSKGLGPGKHPPFKEAFLEGLEDAIQSVYNVFNWIWFDRRTQKVKVRIDRWDTWSMDHTLAPIILPMLKQLKETKHGAPNVDMEDVPKELRATKAQLNKYAKGGDVDPKHFERWDWVMDEMIHAFEQKNKDDWQSYYYSYNDWDMEGMKAEQERISNVFRLFGKYFESLWD